jgi:MFS family permease
MPHMSRGALERFAVGRDDVCRAAVTALGATTAGDGSLVVPVGDLPGDYTLQLAVDADGDGCTVSAQTQGRLGIPFFGWFFWPFVRVMLRRQRAYALARLHHALDGGPEPKPPKGIPVLPTVAFSNAQAQVLATASAAVAIVGFSGALFGQLADPISESFHTSDATLGVALALTRIGAIPALFVTALADRRGRRRSVLIGLAGTAAASAVSAVAPTLAVFTTAQVFQRGFGIATATVAAIVVIEEAPDGARAYAASMLALAGGFGFSFAVIALLFADTGDQGWRIAYVFAAMTILLLPLVARHLVEGERYEKLASRADIARGKLRELFDSRYGRRFILLAFIGFLTNVFNAPSSQLMNKYLTDDRDFSNSSVALFRTVTTAIPGLIGLLVGGRLAEAKGRKPVAFVGLFFATTAQMWFFLSGGVSMWVTSAVSVLAAGAGGIALGTMDAELFPTELRGTSNALLTIITVCGSAAGLIAAGALSDPVGSLGSAIALCGIATLLAVFLFLPRLPEPGRRTLDDVSPSEALRDL